MNIVELEFWRSSASNNFALHLPKDAVVLAMYHRDSRNFVLYQCPDETIDAEERRFYVFENRVTGRNSVEFKEPCNKFRYAGGDTFQTVEGLRTFHYFEILEDKKS